MSADLPLPLRHALHTIGITSLYSHQVEALEYLRAGNDLSLVTPTASGKTLCYNLPILESCLNQPETTALYIFPLKALAFDQMGKLKQLIEAMPPLSHQLKVGLMTGDTPKEERFRLFTPKPPNILAVSPDLLHYHLYHLRRRDDGEPWRQFLRQLRWVVIDEAHTYSGYRLSKLQFSSLRKPSKRRNSRSCLPLCLLIYDNEFSINIFRKMYL